MRDYKRKKILGFVLLMTATLWLFSGAVFSLTLDLAAEEGTVTMPDATVVTMWGLRDTANNPNVGVWSIPVFETTDAVLNITLTNNLPDDTASTLAKPTSLIIPGLQATEPSAMVPTWTDGTTGSRGGDVTKRVRSLTREAPNGAGTESYSWALKPGTYLIQSGTHQAVQVQMGLFAVLVVYPSANPNQAYDASATIPAGQLTFTTEQVLVYSEIDTALHAAIAVDQYGTGKTYTSTMDYDPNYYLVNGQPFSAGAPPINVGQPLNDVLLRFVNAGYETRVPVMQGAYFRLIAEDGNLLPYSQELYSLELAAGKIKDVIWRPAEAGTTNLYDGRFNLTNNGVSGGGLLTKLVATGVGEVFYPNGGEELAGKSTVNIQWTDFPGAATYWVRFSSDGGTTWSRLSTQTAALGTNYSWAIPNNISSTNCLINVIAFDGSGQWLATDSSNSAFSITPAATVLAPNGGEVLGGMAPVNVQWTSHPDAANYWVRFSSDGGTTWSRLATQAAALGTNYSWLIPNNIDSTNCLINVIAFNGAGQWLATDTSDATFSVTPAATVVAPNGGELLNGMDTTTIQWTTLPAAASYWVRFSSDGGTTWSRLTTQTATLGTNYSWSIPNINSTSCLINVIAFDGAGQWLATDTSDGAFSITPVPGATVIAPNGGELFVAGVDTANIQWVAHPDAATYWVRFSSDNGVTWSRLSTQDAVLGTNYSWLIPNNIDSTNCLANVIAFDGAGQWLATDTSDGVFTVAPAP